MYYKIFLKKKMSTTKSQKIEPTVSFPNPEKLKFTKHEVEYLTEKFEEDAGKFIHHYQKVKNDKKKKSEMFTSKISYIPKNKLPVGKTNMQALVNSILPPSSTNVRLGEVNFEEKRKSQSNNFENISVTDSGLNEILKTSPEIACSFINKLRSFVDAKEKKTIQVQSVISVITQTFQEEIANHILHNMQERLVKYEDSFDSNGQSEESTVESEQEEHDANTVVSDDEVEPSSNEDEDRSSDEDKENKETDKVTADSSNTEPQNTQQKENEDLLVRDD